MSTLRNLISSVRSLHRILNTDNLITDRAIAAELRQNASLLIKRETNLRKLWATDTLFTTIPCLELIEVSIAECCNYTDECTIARSKVKLPKLSEGNYQYTIQGVYSINAMGGKGYKFKEITVNRYLNISKLNLSKKEEYFWISNGYLYVTNPNIKAIRLVAYFEEDVPNSLMYADCGCGDITASVEDICKNPLDKEFSLPNYLEQQVLQLTSTKLLATYFRLPSDTTQNNIDAQAPNQTKIG